MNYSRNYPPATFREKLESRFEIILLTYGLSINKNVKRQIALKISSFVQFSTRFV